MANQEQLDILKQGVEEWNEWRRRNPGVKIDLSNTKLNGALLSTALLSSADWRGTDLSNANMGRAHLNEALQPHLFATERRQERRRLSWI